MREPECVANNHGLLRVSVEYAIETLKNSIYFGGLHFSVKAKIVCDLRRLWKISETWPASVNRKVLETAALQLCRDIMPLALDLRLYSDRLVDDMRGIKHYLEVVPILTPWDDSFSNLGDIRIILVILTGMQSYLQLVLLSHRLAYMTDSDDEMYRCLKIIRNAYYAEYKERV